MKGYRKLIALSICVLASLGGAIYMNDTVFVAFSSLMATGLGIFSYSNIQEHKHLQYE